MQGGFWGGLSGRQAEEAFLEKSKRAAPVFRPQMTMPIRGVSRTTSSALRQKVELDRMRAAFGQSDPRVQRQQAALQSKVGYLDRRTSPGSMQNLIINSSGLRSV